MLEEKCCLKGREARKGNTKQQTCCALVLVLAKHQVKSQRWSPEALRITSALPVADEINEKIRDSKSPAKLLLEAPSTSLKTLIKTKEKRSLLS